MKPILLVALLAALAAGQQYNTLGASLILTSDQGATPSALVGGWPNQPFVIFAMAGYPWYGAAITSAGSCDLPIFLPGLFVAAEGTLDAAGAATVAATLALPPGMVFTIQAAVGEPSFLQGVVERGALLWEGLEALAREEGSVTVRGRGLLLALELPERDAPAIARAALDAGLLLNAPRLHTLRFMPALNVAPAELREGLAVLRDVLRTDVGR